MSQFVKARRQTNFKDFKRFGAWGAPRTKKRIQREAFHSRFKLAHSCQKKLDLHTNSLNKLLFCSHVKMPKFTYLILSVTGNFSV
jgi:hypothetical protein